MLLKQGSVDSLQIRPFNLRCMWMKSNFLHENVQPRVKNATAAGGYFSDCN